MRSRLLVLAAVVLMAACTPATATPGRPGHTGATNMMGSPQAHEHVNHRMHADMGIEFSGNADIDFLRGMVPHHQGASDMAKVELKYGKDPEVRKLAEQIIAAQEQEIATMKRWVAAREGASS
jgi:uncharacterized protein (DUF305 family)